MNHKHLLITFILLVAVVLAGCSKTAEAPAAEVSATDTPPGAESAPPDRQPGLSDTNRLAFGTLRLEETENAVTPAQAVELLPLWQMIASGSLQGEAETNAVLKQIQSKMSESQLGAIEDMELAFGDRQGWTPGQDGTPPAPPGEGQGPQGGPGAFGNLSEEERTRMREEFQNMTPEQRATRMAEMGIQRPEGGPEGGPGGGFGFRQGGGGRANGMLQPLIDMLTGRAAE